jgi:hypothetical protein
MALQRPGLVARLALINSLATYRDEWRKWMYARSCSVLIRLLGMRRAALLTYKPPLPHHDWFATPRRALRPNFSTYGVACWSCSTMRQTLAIANLPKVVVRKLHPVDAGYSTLSRSAISRWRPL